MRGVLEKSVEHLQIPVEDQPESGEGGVYGEWWKAEKGGSEGREERESLRVRREERKRERRNERAQRGLGFIYPLCDPFGAIHGALKVLQTS